MTIETWLNLPVADIGRTAKFYEAIGFEKMHVSPDGRMVGFKVGEKKFIVMFVIREQFEHFARCPVADTSNAAEVMVSFDASSVDDVDQMARLVFDAGGTIFSQPSEIMGWMYGFGFTDPDGHRWNMLYMDREKQPKG